MLTNYTDAELCEELTQEIESCLARRDPVHPAWLVHKICKAHLAGLAGPNPDGTNTIESVDRAFWRHNGYANTRKLATTCINRLDQKGEEDDEEPQSWLPGFKLIRPQYVCRRDGVDVMVPTEQMTKAELYARAALFDRNSRTLTDHALELRRYADMPKTQASGQ